MLSSRFQTEIEEVCDVCENTVTECYLLWHPRQAWSGVWLTLCKLCLEESEIYL